jgi:hypothetical protein
MAPKRGAPLEPARIFKEVSPREILGKILWIFASAAPTMQRKNTKNFIKIFGLAHLVRKFLDSLILETPLIVLQYYKPSFSIYIYPYKEGLSLL